jgi:hypothetical protein
VKCIGISLSYLERRRIWVIEQLCIRLVIWFKAVTRKLSDDVHMCVLKI